MSAIESTSTGGQTEPPAWFPSFPYRLSLEEYERMVDVGIIPTTHRVHLINGILVAKRTQKPPHVTSANLYRDELDRIKPDGCSMRSAQPIRLPARDSEPEPDHCLVRGTTRDHEQRHPEPAEVALLVEIAESSLADDRKMATEVYGPSGIPVYWIVDLIHRRVEVHTNPGPHGYASCEIFAESQSVPVVIDGREVGRIAVEDILPRRPRAANEGNGA